MRCAVRRAWAVGVWRANRLAEPSCLALAPRPPCDAPGATTGGSSTATLAANQSFLRLCCSRGCRGSVLSRGRGNWLWCGSAFGRTAGARQQRAFPRKRCSGHFSCQGLSTQAVVSQAGAWTGLQFQGCGDTQWFDSTSAATACSRHRASCRRCCT